MAQRSDGPTVLIPAERLADELGLSVSILNFLERQVPELSAVMTGLTLQYRAADAAVLAGLSELLYVQGVTLRDAGWALRSGEREAIADLGRSRLADLFSELDRAAARNPAPRTPIPRDATVRRGGASDAPLLASHKASAKNAALLRELMGCVRLLQEARLGEAGARRAAPGDAAPRHTAPRHAPPRHAPPRHAAQEARHAARMGPIDPPGLA